MAALARAWHRCRCSYFKRRLMENRVTTGTMVALAFSAALAFAAHRQQPEKESTKARETSTATVTGCVQPGAGPKTYVLAESPSALVPPGAAALPPQARDR